MFHEYYIEGRRGQLSLQIYVGRGGGTYKVIMQF